LEAADGIYADGRRPLGKVLVEAAVKLTSDEEYQRAMREFSGLEGRPLNTAETARKEELEAVIAAYAAEPGKPDRRKGRPSNAQG
jgi:hypothetical protein